MRYLAFCAYVFLCGCGSVPPGGAVLPAAVVSMEEIFIMDTPLAEVVEEKPAFPESEIIVDARNFGDGSFTGETILAAVKD
jgi:hypothetical protein